MQPFKIKILDPRLNERDIAYATPGSAGIDLRACIERPLWLRPGETALIPAGFAMHMDNSGFTAVLAPRSGLGTKHGVVLANLVGVIDSDYQGEIKVALWNRSQRSYDVNPMERIAQMLIVPIIQPQFEFVSSFELQTERGAGGFGSTGRD